ncbi:MAG: hypothetical protein AAFQ94_00820 [Bacteroidota bacterium]
MENTELSEKESLKIIEGMISKAKGSVVSNQFYFVLWGWIIALINLFVYFSQTLFEFPYAHLAWLICFPLGIFTAVHASVKAKKRPVKTHLQDMFSYMWLAFFVMVIIVVGAGPKIGFNINPMIVLITGFPTFITGVAIKFKPLIYGGAAFWLFAVLGFVLPFEYHSLVGAAAIIVGYLVPGYLLKQKVKNESL